jgi:hypothetical protein
MRNTANVQPSMFDIASLANRDSFWLKELPFQRRLSNNLLSEGEMFINSGEDGIFQPAFFMMFNDRLVMCNVVNFS